MKKIGIHDSGYQTKVSNYEIRGYFVWKSNLEYYIDIVYNCQDTVDHVVAASDQCDCEDHIWWKYAIAHKVGAGKSYEIVTAAQELKRIGLCHKSMIVVPNQLVGQ